MTRRLVVNADDLGYDPEIDRGILEAARAGAVTSATAMVDTPFVARALAEAPASLGVGLHLVLAPGLEGDALAREVARQLARFEALRGRPPTHLDGHKHAHLRPGALEAVAAAAKANGLPVRSTDAASRARLRDLGVRTADAFLGDAALRPCWTADRLLAALARVGEGTTELMAHPGYRPAVARTSFGAEREEELRALLDPRLPSEIARLGLGLAHW
ncbi:carbohydrate deacetylase [Anaeromyxobacter paludicola]|uniref:Chitooligosaccharide deacetylase n=1 Tax=Anaeromyxobacter paludicola TaxID=2918171 RepID=A0ABM7X7G2_9BACT|nr:ChbG/HpnK family deacetylase [Anaeromyxobacter paludicola]BDG07734.1 chitooligosaccharide deacetylase [Anaeromyxobacter paludicola]